MTELMRWGVQWTRTPHHGTDAARCRHCGYTHSETRPNCPPAICLACDSRVCLQPRKCPVCYVGHLRGVAYSAKECGYTGCSELAVADAPRVRVACAKHLSRARNGRLTVRQYVDDRLAIRDGITREPHAVYRYVQRPEAITS